MSHDLGFAQTESGILIPAQTLDRLERRITPQEFKKLCRVLAFATANDMRALFLCKTCNAPIRVNHHDQLVTELKDAGKMKPAGGGRISLQCGCTTWAVK